MPCTVTNGHNNAVRQGLVCPLFLCLTSIDGVYALTLKCAPRYLVPVAIWCDVRSAPNELIGGRSLADPLLNSLHRVRLQSSEEEFENLIYNRWTWGRKNGGKTSTASTSVRDAVCFSASLMKLLIYPVESL